MHTRKLLIMLITTGTVLTACGQGDDDSTTVTPTVNVAEAPAESSVDPEGSASSDVVTVMVATDPVLGEYLVDSDGRTLYLFAKDQGTTTACTGPCVDNWPPVVADGMPTGGDGIDVAQLATADGNSANQVTYHGHLLYYFAGDQAAGDTNGIGIPEWYALNPAGAAIETG